MNKDDSVSAELESLRLSKYYKIQMQEWEKRKELKNYKPTPQLCMKCNCQIEPQWKDSSREWLHDCQPCKEKRKIEHEKAIRESHQERNRQNSGLYRKMQYMTFDTLEGSSVIYNLAKKYAQEFEEEYYLAPNGLYIFGAVGSGKTHLSCAIANYILDNTTYPISFTNIMDFLSKARDYKNNETETRVISELNKNYLIIIDDLGIEKLTEWAIQTIYKLIDDRMNVEGPIIITSNFSLQELEERIGGVAGERIVSRLASMCKVIKTPDYNFRLKQNKYK